MACTWNSPSTCTETSGSVSSRIPSAKACFAAVSSVGSIAYSKTLMSTNRFTFMESVAGEPISGPKRAGRRDGLALEAFSALIVRFPSTIANQEFADHSNSVAGERSNAFDLPPAIVSIGVLPFKHGGDEPCP